MRLWQVSLLFAVVCSRANPGRQKSFEDSILFVLHVHLLSVQEPLSVMHMFFGALRMSAYMYKAKD